MPKSGERTQVRLLCYRLPQEQAKKARERKAAKLRKKHGRTYNQELVWWASWVLLVTTTDEAVWSGQELLYLYRARWQIELLFKRIKQCLRLHQLRLKDWQRVSCVLHFSPDWLVASGARGPLAPRALDSSPPAAARTDQTARGA